MPQNLEDKDAFGFSEKEIDQFSIAKTVRMSMSIPLFFEPVKLSSGSSNSLLVLIGAGKEKEDIEDG